MSIPHELRRVVSCQHLKPHPVHPPPAAAVEPDVTAGDPHGLVQEPEVIQLPAPRPAARPPRTRQPSV